MYCKILEKNEYIRHIEPMLDSQGFAKNYTKEIKTLLKRERIQRKLEATYTDEDELNENNIMPEAFDPRVADVVSAAVKKHIK